MVEAAEKTEGKAETEAQAKTLEELLAEWPSNDGGADKAMKAGNGVSRKAPTPEELAAFMEQTQQKLETFDTRASDLDADAQERNQRAFIKQMRDSNPDLKDVDDETILDFGVGEMGRNTDLERAWMQRRQHKSQWNQVAKGLADKLAKRLGPRVKADDGADADAANRRLASRSAARTSTTTKAPDPRKEEDAKALSMSDAEFRDHIWRTTRTRI